jgi:hypothetical protein
MSSKIFEKLCEHDLNQRENEKMFRISHNNDDRFQHENVKVWN